MKTNITKRSIWKSLLVFLLVLSLFYLTDLLTKLFIFDKHHLFRTEDEKITNWIVIGFRSVPHDNSTLFSALGVSLPLYAHYIINFGLAFLFSLPALFARSYSISIGTGILVAGILGNTIDKLITSGEVIFNGQIYSHYVMDILFLPWFDRGTFNFADVWIVLGAGFLLLFFIIGLIKDFSRRNNVEIEPIKNVDDAIEKAEHNK